MKKSSYITALSGALILSSSVSASATVFDFNTTNFGLAGSSTVDSATMTVDGITVVLSAFSIENDDLGVILSMSELTRGTGVYVSGSSNNVGVRSNLSSDNTNIDGGAVADDLDEGILFTFSQAVTLDFINFDSFSNSGGDDFNLTVDGASILVDHNQLDGTVAGVVSNGAQSDYFDFSVTGTEFLIWADSDSDSFRIDSLNATVVPVPAAAWLFGSGIIGLIGIARRKK